MKKFLTKAGWLGLAQKGQKQVYDIQHNALISLIHFVQLYSKVDQGRKCIALEVIHLFLSFLWQIYLFLNEWKQMHFRPTERESVCKLWLQEILTSQLELHFRSKYTLCTVTVIASCCIEQEHRIHTCTHTHIYLYVQQHFENATIPYTSTFME